MPEPEIASVGADVDVRVLMEEIRETVERKREEGAYPPDILAELDALRGPGSSFGEDALDQALLDLHRSSGFSADVTTASEKPVVAPLVSGVKRGVLTVMRWYLSGILQQVSAFAGHAVRAVRLLRDRTAVLAERIDELEDLRELPDRVRQNELRLDHLERFPEIVEDLRARVETVEGGREAQRLAHLDRAVRDLRERLEGVSAPSGTGATPPEQPGPRPEDGEPPSGARTRRIERRLDYLEFEDRFRGAEEDVEGRQRAYVDLFRDAPGRVVDLGCGRGEFLRLLGEAGIDAYGVDRHRDMVLHCREAELEAVEGEALAHLRSREPGSLGGAFSAQMIEHLEPSEVPAFFEAAADALAPGGVLVVETINPGSLFVFASAFYVDLSHMRPLHPLTLRFLADTAGFSEVEVRYTSPVPAERRPGPVPRTGGAEIDAALSRIEENFERIDEVLFGPQDYAIVARR